MARAREAADGGNLKAAGQRQVRSPAAGGLRTGTEARRCDARRSRGRGPVTRKLWRQYTTTTDGEPSRLDPEQAERLRLCLFPPAAITAAPAQCAGDRNHPAAAADKRAVVSLYILPCHHQTLPVRDDMSLFAGPTIGSCRRCLAPAVSGSWRQGTTMYVMQEQQTSQRRCIWSPRTASAEARQI